SENCCFHASKPPGPLPHCAACVFRLAHMRVVSATMAMDRCLRLIIRGSCIRAMAQSKDKVGRQYVRFHMNAAESAAFTSPVADKKSSAVAAAADSSPAAHLDNNTGRRAAAH